MPAICLMQKNLLIFDFDGTIANTLAVAHHILNEVGQEFNLPKVNQQQVMALKGKSVREAMKMANMPWWKLPLFVRKARVRFREHLEKVSPIQGMPEILDALRQRSYRMGILTSNSEEGVRLFIEAHQLGDFEFIHAPDSIFGKSRMIKRILSQNQLEPEAVIMIGDEVRDVNAANKAGIDSIAVSWGFNSEDLLRNSKPTHLIHNPNDLLQLLA
ncbi:MAG: HAD-IA family hydrolase [Bacteroidota bacterium]